MNDSQNAQNVQVVPQWTLGDRMRKALDHASVSVEEMAEYLGYSTATMRNWTRDRAVPRPTVLRQWALRTGCDYHWLVTGDTSPQVAQQLTVTYARGGGPGLARSA